MSRATKFELTSMTTTPSWKGETVRTPVPVEVLFDICRRPRFAGTPGEQYVIETYIEKLPGVREDAYGNYWVQVGDDPVTMFSCHTDTVHKASADNSPYKLSFKKGWLSVKGGGVLGADDGTGIWIMLNLIEAGVPGLYIFHREEEIGGKGSIYIAMNHATLLTGIKHCIAFDRKGYSDVITHQYSRCCSDEFAQALADQLNLDTDFTFAPSKNGVFTDSANYTDLIGECTNLSVGYFDQHTTHECQDTVFLTKMVDRLIQIDFSALPAVRQPGEADPDDLAWVNYRDYPSHSSSSTKALRSIEGRDDFAVISEMCQRYPGEIADLLMEQGWTAADLVVELEEVYGCDIAGGNNYVDDDYPGLH